MTVALIIMVEAAYSGSHNTLNPLKITLLVSHASAMLICIGLVGVLLSWTADLSSFQDTKTTHTTRTLCEFLHTLCDFQIFVMTDVSMPVLTVKDSGISTTPNGLVADNGLALCTTFESTGLKIRETYSLLCSLCSDTEVVHKP